MEMIDRYLYEVGKFLAPGQRDDILSELRSSLSDSIEARAGAEAGEDAVVEVLKEMGPPRQVAASYYPEGQYLIGPALYPMFRLVVGVALTAIVGAQLLAVGLAFVLGNESVSLLSNFWAIINSIPGALGFIVITFALLQRYGIRPELDEAEFDPRELPEIAGTEPVNRFEHILSVIIGAVFLAWLAQFGFSGGFSGADGAGVFTNPVLARFFPWLGFLVLLGIVMDIVLLWRGRWTAGTRMAKIVLNILSMALLAIMIDGHSSWLAEAGVGGLLDGLRQIPTFAGQSSQIIGMIFFRVILAGIFVAYLIEVLVQLYRMWMGFLRRRNYPTLATA